MKLSIHQDERIQETEIIINCAYMDKRLQKLTDYIRQYSFSLEGESEGKLYQIPLEQILEEFAKKAFREYAGIAQQYLFYYARENKIKGID